MRSVLTKCANWGLHERVLILRLVFLTSKLYTLEHAHSLPYTVSAKHNLSAHLLPISNNMSNAKWEIWISFLCRQSLIHWQRAQMWEDDFFFHLGLKPVQSFWMSRWPVSTGLVSMYFGKVEG